MSTPQMAQGPPRAWHVMLGTGHQRSSGALTSCLRGACHDAVDVLHAREPGGPHLLGRQQGVGAGQARGGPAVGVGRLGVKLRATPTVVGHRLIVVLRARVRLEARPHLLRLRKGAARVLLVRGALLRSQEAGVQGDAPSARTSACCHLAGPAQRPPCQQTAAQGGAQRGSLAVAGLHWRCPRCAVWCMAPAAKTTAPWPSLLLAGAAAGKDLALGRGWRGVG